MAKGKFHLLRWLFGGGVVTVVVVAVIVLLVVNASLGTIVQKSITTFGPKLLGTDIQVEKVKLSLLRGDLQVKNLVLGNPQGYNTPSIMEIGELHVKLDPLTVFKDTIHVKLIDIDSPQLTYEVGLGNSNVSTLLDTLAKDEEAEKKAEATEESSGKRVVIDQVRVSGGSIQLAAKITGGTALPVPLPTITLNDIGKSKEEKAAEAKASETAEAVQASAAQAKAEGTSVVKATCEILTSIFTSAVKAIGEGAADAAGAVADGVKNAADAAVDGVKNAAGAAVDGVKNLFGGDK